VIQGHRPNRDGVGLADEERGALIEIWLALPLIMNHMITHNVYYVKLCVIVTSTPRTKPGPDAPRFFFNRRCKDLQLNGKRFSSNKSS